MYIVRIDLIDTHDAASRVPKGQTLALWDGVDGLYVSRRLAKRVAGYMLVPAAPNGGDDDDDFTSESDALDSLDGPFYERLLRYAARQDAENATDGNGRPDVLELALDTDAHLVHELYGKTFLFLSTGAALRLASGVQPWTLMEGHHRGQMRTLMLVPTLAYGWVPFRYMVLPSARARAPSADDLWRIAQQAFPSEKAFFASVTARAVPSPDPTIDGRVFHLSCPAPLRQSAPRSGGPLRA
jgi:hypothetical protein